MAKRASEKSFFGADAGDGGMPGEGDGDGRAGGGGGGSGGGGMDGVSSGPAEGGGSGGEGMAPRKSFVMKRGWGSMKMVEVRDKGRGSGGYVRGLGEGGRGRWVGGGRCLGNLLNTSVATQSICLYLEIRRQMVQASMRSTKE